jgi:hypothetical protein
MINMTSLNPFLARSAFQAIGKERTFARVEKLDENERDAIMDYYGSREVAIEQYRYALKEWTQKTFGLGNRFHYIVFDIIYGIVCMNKSHIKRRANKITFELPIKRSLQQEAFRIRYTGATGNSTAKTIKTQLDSA